MKSKGVLAELKHHIPFTATATLIAIILVIIFRYTNTEPAFEIIHPAHIFASAIVTSAIFYKYKPKFFQALLIGLTGSIIIGTFSDIIFPYLGGLIFQLNTSLHLSIIEEPLTILGVALAGCLFGITTKYTKVPHLIHVLLSVFASLFYIIAFSTHLNFINFTASFFIVFVAVLIPCCISDIIYPMLFVRKK